MLGAFVRFELLLLPAELQPYPPSVNRASSHGEGTKRNVRLRFPNISTSTMSNPAKNRPIPSRCRSSAIALISGSNTAASSDSRTIIALGSSVCG
jgi:hypothetical protein